MSAGISLKDADYQTIIAKECGGGVKCLLTWSLSRLAVLNF